MTSIPDDYHDLFEKPTIAHLSTLLPDGAPHSAPVWIDYDYPSPIRTERVILSITVEHATGMGE